LQICQVRKVFQEQGSQVDKLIDVLPLPTDYPTTSTNADTLTLQAWKQWGLSLMTTTVTDLQIEPTQTCLKSSWWQAPFSNQTECMFCCTCWRIQQLWTHRSNYNQGLERGKRSFEI